MSKGPKLICLVTVNDEIGIHVYYAGTPNKVEALSMAADRGHEGDAVSAKQIPNKFAIQHGAWTQATP